MDNNRILEKFKTKIAIFNSIENNFNSSKTIISINKSILIILTILLITTGVTLATTKLTRNWGYTSSDGVQTAIDNQYISNVNTIYKSSDGISVSINSFLIDDANFSINFDFEFSNKNNIIEILTNNMYNHFNIADLKVVNEKGEKVFATKELEAEEIQKLYKTYEEAKEKYDFSNCGYGMNFEILSSNKLRYYLTATGDFGTFPPSKTLYVTFNKLTIDNYVDKNVQDSIYEGEWSYEIDVPNKMSKSNIVNFKLKSISDKNYEFVAAKVSNTAFKIYLKNCEGISYYRPQPYQDPYVENSKGDIFYPSRASDGAGSINIDSEGKTTYYETFNLTNFDVTDTLTVHLFKKNGEEVVVKLIKGD